MGIREKTSKEAQIFTLADLNEVLPPLRLSSWTNRMAGSFLKARFGLCSRAWPCKAAFFWPSPPFRLYARVNAQQQLLSRFRFTVFFFRLFLFSLNPPNHDEKNQISHIRHTKQTHMI